MLVRSLVILIMSGMLGCSKDVITVPGGPPEFIPVTDGSFGVRAPAWSPDGRFIAFEMHRDGVHIAIVDPRGGDPRVISNEKYQFDPVWTPDAGQVYFVNRGDESGNCSEIWSYNISTESLTFICDGDLPSFSPDGRFLLTSTLGPPGNSGWPCDKPLRVVLREADGGGILDTLDWVAEYVPPAWSPADPRVAYVGFASRFCGWGLCPWWYIWIAPVDGSRGEEISGTGNPEALSWSPGGSLIAFASMNQIHLIEVRSRMIIDVDSPPEIRINGVSWSPDGRELAASGGDGEGSYLYVVRNVLR